MVMATRSFPASPLPWCRSPASNLHWLFARRDTRSPLSAQQLGRDADGNVLDPELDAASASSYFAFSTPSPSVERSRKRGEALARLRSAFLAVLARARRGLRSTAMGSAVTVTIFGRLRGRVHLALQPDPRAPPALVLELAAYSTGALVREMASGLVRLALECQRAPPPSPAASPRNKQQQRRRRRVPLLEETTWRAYCNGRKCGYAVRRECGAEERRLLRAVEQVSVGAGVLPDDGGGGEGEGDMMYMRARFERVVGSRDSEALYMVSPDGDAGGDPELSIYLLRV